MKEFLSKPIGRIAVIGGATVLLVVVMGLVFGSRGDNEPVADSSSATDSGKKASSKSPVTKATASKDATASGKTADPESTGNPAVATTLPLPGTIPTTPRRTSSIEDLVVDHATTPSGYRPPPQPPIDSILRPPGNGGSTSGGPLIAGVGQMGGAQKRGPDDMAPEMDPTKPYSPPAPTVQPNLRAHTGNVRARVLRARVMKSSEAPGLAERSLATTDGPAYALLIDIEVSNVGMSPIFYQSWNEFLMFDLPVALNDDIDSRYRHRTRNTPTSELGVKPRGSVFSLTDGNILAAAGNKEKPVVVLFTCLNNDEGRTAKESIQYLANDYAGRVNVGCYHARPGDQPNTFYNTPAIVHYKITNLPLVIIFEGGQEKARQQGVALGPLEEALDLLVGKPEAAGTTIPPGETFQETVAFDIPRQGASILKLNLPAMAVGSPGEMLEFIIPTQSIEVTP